MRLRTAGVSPWPVLEAADAGGLSATTYTARCQIQPVVVSAGQPVVPSSCPKLAADGAAEPTMAGIRVWDSETQEAPSCFAFPSGISSGWHLQDPEMPRSTTMSVSLLMLSLRRESAVAQRCPSSSPTALTPRQPAHRHHREPRWASGSCSTEPLVSRSLALTSTHHDKHTGSQP